MTKGLVQLHLAGRLPRDRQSESSYSTHRAFLVQICHHEIRFRQSGLAPDPASVISSEVDPGVPKVAGPLCVRLIGDWCVAGSFQKGPGRALM